jgi:hypothetical protein
MEKTCTERNFGVEKEDMSRQKRMYGSPVLH